MLAQVNKGKINFYSAQFFFSTKMLCTGLFAIGFIGGSVGSGLFREYMIGKAFNSTLVDQMKTRWPTTANDSHSNCKLQFNFPSTTTSLPARPVNAVIRGHLYNQSMTVNNENNTMEYSLTRVGYTCRRFVGVCNALGKCWNFLASPLPNLPLYREKNASAFDVMYDHKNLTTTVSIFPFTSEIKKSDVGYLTSQFNSMVAEKMVEKKANKTLNPIALATGAIGVGSVLFMFLPRFRSHRVYSALANVAAGVCLSFIYFC